MPRLSIVIPSHRRADLLRACLASVTRCRPPDCEVLVLDDGSPDGSVSRAAAEFPGVAAHRLSSRRGFCAAANAGLRLARAPVVELLNDDTEVTPGWADAAVRHFTTPGVGAVAPLVLWGPPHAGTPRIDSAGDGYHLGGFARKRGHGDPLGPLAPRSVFGASGSSAFYRRDVVLELGGFPEEFGAYFEDVDLSFRLRRAGHDIRFEPASRVWHRVSASHAARNPELLRQQSRNEERVFWRNLPADLLPRALPLHLAVLAGKALRRLSVGEFLPFLRGRVDAWRAVRADRRHARSLPGVTGWRHWHLDAGLTAPGTDR